jgi:hypothetical protein
VGKACSDETQELLLEGSCAKDVKSAGSRERFPALITWHSYNLTMAFDLPERIPLTVSIHSDQAPASMFPECF